MESLKGHNHTQSTARNILWTFFKEDTHSLLETSCRGRCNSQEFDLDNPLYL